MNVRATGLAVLVAGLVAGCVPDNGVPTPSPAPSRCTSGYSSQLVLHLAVGDNGHPITTRLCYAIDVLLVGPPSVQWGTVQTSNATILALLPFPLAPPPPGGTHEVYLAESTGSAVLSSVGASVAVCPINCAPAHWAVSITVGA